MNVECENLDAYLSDDLSPGDSVRYEAHLHACDTCREAVSEQRWIDALLGSPERLALESVSAALSGSVRNSIVSRRRQAQLVACGLAAAAALAIALGWTAVLNRQPTGPAVKQIAGTTLPAKQLSPSPSLRARGTAETPRAVFVGGTDVITVPVPSRHPNVTIVRVYPTYQASLASESASDDCDADFFDGG